MAPPPVILPLTSVLGDTEDPPPMSVDWQMKQPGVQADCAAIPIIETKCIMCNEHAQGRRGAQTCKKCKDAFYETQDCLWLDAELHRLLCDQAADYETTHQNPASRVRVIVLHATHVKADFAWAKVVQNGLELRHAALNDFRLSQKNSIIVEPELINWQLRNFQETRWLGHCVLLWTLCNWKELPIGWVNRTALFMGGKAGHTNLFYGPLVISVLRQDTVIQKVRTPDHAQMRTLRQVADYIQMVDDNPCVANPSRFVPVPDSYGPEPDLAPIPGVKVNDKFELDVMGPLGMKSPKEEVFVSVSRRTQAQGPAAVPFVLGLRWYARTAKLDMIIETDETEITALVEPDLIWAQWEIELLPADPHNPSRRKAGVAYAHHNRSMVMIQAGGAPLRIEHIDAFSRYLQMSQERVKDRAAISKDGFAAFWRETYGFSDVPSPYQLEASHPVNLFEDDAEVVQAFEAAAASHEIKKKVLHFNAVRAETLIKRLIMTYPDDQVVMIVETLVSYCKGEKSIEDMQVEVASFDPVSEEKVVAVTVVRQLVVAHMGPELQDIASYINKYVKKHYLTWFTREAVQRDTT